MNISIIPGATCAVIQIKIKGFSNNKNTSWKFLYKKASDSNYSETEEMTFRDNTVYGYGPVFYDLTDLEPETTYRIKLVVTDSGEPMDAESSEKEFTTVSLGDFEFNSHTYVSAYLNKTEEDFITFLDWFKNQMIAVGYDYKLTQERSPHPFTDRTGFSPNIYCDREKVEEYGAGAITYGYKGDIYLKFISINESYDKSALVHEYRHFLGLSDSYRGITYHSEDPSDAGFNITTYPEYSSNISKVVGFSRGLVNSDMDIYMFYGENSVDSVYIPNSFGYKCLGFMLLKALGLNDITIVY